MANDDMSKTQYLELAERMVRSLQDGKHDEFETVVEELTDLRETTLFQEVGRLTRELHEALKSFKLDSRLTDIAATEIPDARDRLNYVLTMTDQAAHRTLNAVEASANLTEEFTGKSGHLLEQWQRFRKRELSADQFRQLSRELEDFLALVQDNGTQLQANLSDALMAQDFQDLTGQVIRRVITLVQEVEDGLVDLMRLSRPGGLAEKTAESAEAADKKARDDAKGTGPAIPGQDNEDVVQGQDDVDDLLSSLGF